MPFDPSKVDLGSISEVAPGEKVDVGFGGQDDDLEFTMGEAAKVNPDQHAEVIDLSRKTGIPSFAVEADVEPIKQIVNKNEFDFSGLRDKSPTTANYLTNIDNAIIAQDDVDVLQSIEGVLNTAVDTVEAFGAGAATGVLGLSESLFRTPDAVRRTARGVSQSIEDLTGLPEYLNPIRGIEDIADYFASGQIPGTSIRTGGLTGIANQVDTAQQILSKNFDPFQANISSAQKADNALIMALSGDFEGLIDISTDPVAMAGFLGQALPSLATSYLSGGSIPFIAWMESMEVASDAADFESRTGVKINDADFIQAQVQAGVVNSILEKIVPDALLKGKAGESYLAVFETALKEFATEGAQGFNTNLAEKLSFDPDKELTQGVLASALGGLGAGAVSAGSQKAIRSMAEREIKRNNQSRVEQQKIDELNKQAENSKLRERDKESFKQFVSEADGENNTQVFIDGAQVSLYLQSKTPEEIAADPALKMLSEKASEASALGGDVQVPVADFAGEIAGTEHYTQLRDAMTLSGESVSPFRQEQVQKETESYIKALMDEAQQNASEYVEAQQIYDTVREQLIDSGQVTPANASVMAQIVPAWATAQARRSGKTVQQVYQDSGLTVEGPQTGERARLEGEQVLEQGVFDTKEVRELQKKLSQIENEFETLRKPGAYDEKKWESIGKRASSVRSELMKITGDPYGKPKKKKTTRPSDELLNADYESPGLVPQQVMDWLVKNNQILTSDATDAVRWSRIYNTLDDERYPPGDVTVYRAVVGDEIRPGDWVTTSRKYAEEHNSKYLEGKGSVVEDVVDGSDLLVSPTGDAEEAIFAPREFSGDSFEQVLEQGGVQPVISGEGFDRPFEQSPVSTETEEFKRWSEGGEVVEPEDVNNYIFKADTPVVLKVFHGTTHDFDVFDAKRGNLESQFGAVNYFTSSEQDATDNYAGEGPDLTNRIEQRAEQLEYDIQEVIDEESLEDAVKTFIPDTDQFIEDAGDIALVLARQELSGGVEQTMELFVKVKNPFVVGENAEWIEFVDNDAIQTEAIKQVAEDNDITVEEVNDNIEDYEEQIDEKRWEIEADTPNKIIEAVQTVSDRHDVDAANLAGQVYDLGSEAKPEDIENLLRESEDYMYAEDPENGEMLQSQLIAEVIEEMGFDSIILRNAEDRFENMNIESETAHVHIFDSNKTNIKSVENVGTFDPTDPNIFKQRPGAKSEARGYYDPVNSIIRLTESADLSTFLHEFAHFMYEMELNGNTEMVQSINSWFKRNAEGVAKEANGYLGEKFEVLKQGEDYRGEHRAPGPDDAPLFDVTKDGDIYPDDIYSVDGLRFYGTGQDKADAESISVIQSVKGKPNARVKIYRAVPHTKTNEETLAQLEREMDAYLKRNTLPDDVSDGAAWYDNAWETREELRKIQDEVAPPPIKINTGDWVTLSRSYAKEHGESALNGEYKIISKTVNAKELFTNGDSINEFGYWEKGKVTDILAQPTDQPTAKEGSITADDVVAFLDQTTTGNKDKDAAIRRAVHEQFARGFEQYLMEGKAPSIELRNAFRAFARWLTQIYQSLRNKLNVNLDPQMREVFDRLLATEEQIAAAEARARVEPMFTDAAMAGMTEEEFANYQKRQEKVKDVQTETLRDKIIKQLTRQTEKWWKEEKQDIIDEEIETLKKERVYAARERLKAGDLKLDHATVKEMVGEKKTNKIGRTSIIVPPKLIGMTAKGQQGVHPDEAAVFLGYESGSEMLKDLVEATPIGDRAEANAEARMIERHGDILTDGTIEREADEAVQNEERGKLILSELKALAKGTSVPTIDRATIKELAKTNIGKLSFREIHPAKYRRAEIRAAQEAARMLAEGNRDGAAAAKLRQVMNYYLGMEAMNAKNETTKIVDRMSRYGKKKIREAIVRAENGYWDQISKILSRFEFRKSATLKEVESINTWMKERTESGGDGLVLSNAVLDESYVTHWKDVPFSDLQGINDSVKNIEHVARYANKIKLQQEEIDFKKLKQQWVDHINEQDQRFATKENRSRIDDSREAVAMEHIRKWASQLTKVPFLASWLDGGERTGLSQDILIQQLTDALDAKIKMIDEVATPVMKMISNRSKADQKRHNTKIWIPEINDYLMGHQILAVALNTGNQSNLKKLLLGEGWADPDVEAEVTFDNSKLQAVLAHMTKSDWELVQKIWDQMELLYPQLAEVHRRTTGLTPPKVVSTPIVTKYGTFKGGYYPVKYSPRRSHKAEKNAEKRDAETESMFNNTASIQSSVNAGATNERTGFYDRIYLSLEVVPDHFNETIHYITHHDAVRQINRLIQSPEVANAITSVLGEEEFKQLKPWLNDVAKDGRQQPVKTYIDEAFGRLRFGTTLGVMGFKASTGIMQIFGLLTTAAELGPGSTMQGIFTTVGRSWYMKAVRNLLGSRDDMQTGWEFATERSKVMSHRALTMDREIKNAMDRLRGKAGLIAAVQETSMKHIALIQTYMVDLPTWFAAYNKEISESGDEAKAIKRADWSVENLQGSGATKDMATILRSQSKIHTTFTMFMTFFSSLGNLSRDMVKGKRTGIYSVTSVAAKSMFLYTIPVFLEMLMRGDFDEPEDEDERLGKFATAVALYPLTSVPFVRDVASGLIGDYGYNSSPVASVLEKGIQGAKQIGERAFTDEEITKSAIKNTSKLAAAAAGIPGVNQAWATGEHLYDVIEEGEDLTARELLFGPDRK